MNSRHSMDSAAALPPQVDTVRTARRPNRMKEVRARACWAHTLRAWASLTLLALFAAGFPQLVAAPALADVLGVPCSQVRELGIDK